MWYFAHPAFLANNRMDNSKFITHHFQYNNLLKRVCIILLCLFCFNKITTAQCPPNIDFEKGTFEGWTCYIGTTEEDQGQNFIYLAPVAGPVVGRHEILSASPGDGVDEYGGFPKNCPNGSGHSIKLGNNIGSAQAEGLSYDFTIPATSNKYRLTYNYAVVIQDPGHQVVEQPRMEIEIFNLTDNVVIDCSSFSFVANNTLPGFQVSSNPQGLCPVIYKDWSANTINLDGFEGKSIRFFVKTADCTFSAHFGYAYIDIVAECGSTLEGAIFCKDDSAINVVGPYGYMNYNWLSNDLSHIIGTGQVLHLQPAPAPGTIVAVELTPYPGYGCIDTITQVLDTIHSSANAGGDKTPCNLAPVQLGTESTFGLLYNWSPSYGLNDINSPNPFATPDHPIEYHLTVSSAEGGCISKDSVLVSPQIINDSLGIIGNKVFCLGNADAAILFVIPSDSIIWIKNGSHLNNGNTFQYSVTGTGEYQAILYNNLCTDPVLTNKINIIVDTARQGIRYADVDVPINFPQRILARTFGNQVMWNPIQNLSNPAIYNPFFKGQYANLYTVQIKTQTGCITVDTQYIRTYKKIDIYVPTVFTPNGDGLNDYLRPLLLGFNKINYFKIYNRWGKLLYSTTNDIPGWDGRVNNIPQEPQTIVWIIEAIDIDGGLHKQSGTTIILP